MADETEHSDSDEVQWERSGVAASMPKQDRRIFFGLIGVIVILGAMGLLNVSHYELGYKNDRRQTTPYEPHDTQSSTACTESSTFAAKIECVMGKVRANQEEERAQADLHAQQDMAIWAQAMFWITILALVLSAGGVYLIYETLKATRESVLVDRAWLTVRACGDAEISFDESEPMLSSSFEFSNLGRLAAYEVAIESELMLFPVDDDIGFEERVLSIWNAGISQNINGYADTVIPGEQKTWSFFSFPPPGWVPIRKDEALSTWLVMLIKYRITPHSRDLKYTGALFRVDKNQSRRRGHQHDLIWSGEDCDVILVSHPLTKVS